MNNIRLRAETANDAAYVLELYVVRHKEIFSQAPMPAEQLEMLANHQANAQLEHYAKHFAEAQFLIIECNGERAGRLIILEEPSCLKVVDVVIDTSFQGQGVGSVVFKRFIKDAKLKKLPLRLKVATNNPGGQRFYARLGFKEYARDEMNIDLEILPSDTIEDGLVTKDTIGTGSNGHDKKKQLAHNVVIEVIGTLGDHISSGICEDEGKNFPIGVRSNIDLGQSEVTSWTILPSQVKDSSNVGLERSSQQVFHSSSSKETPVSNGKMVPRDNDRNHK